MPTLTTPETFPTATLSQSSAGDIANFLFASYLHSQGDEGLQGDLFAYGRQYYAERLSVLQQSDHEYIQEQVVDCAVRWMTPGAHVSRGEGGKITLGRVRDDVSARYNALLSDAYPEKLDDTYDRLVTKNIVGRDYRWIVDRRAGRPHRSNNTGNARDPYLSHAVHYGLLANTAHEPVFDAIYARVGGKVLELLQEDSSETLMVPLPKGVVEMPLTACLAAVIQTYDMHHPAQREALHATLEGCTIGQSPVIL